MFETFDHTADVGLRVTAPDLPSLFAEASRALVAAMLGADTDVNETRRLEIFLEAPDLVDLMHDWLAELHFYFETERFVCSRADVTVSEDGKLAAVAFGETLAPACHEIEMEVKAVTYHGLKVERGGEGWLCEVILDL